MKDKKAFPSKKQGSHAYDNHVTYIEEGMTLREYYAGQVGPILMQKSLSVGTSFDLAVEVSTKDAVKWADALIAALEETEK